MICVMDQALKLLLEKIAEHVNILVCNVKSDAVIVFECCTHASAIYVSP